MKRNPKDMIVPVRRARFYENGANTLCPVPSPHSSTFLPKEHNSTTIHSIRFTSLGKGRGGMREREKQGNRYPE